MWVGFFNGFFKWARPKKPAGFFWVRTRVSEPWSLTGELSLACTGAADLRLMGNHSYR